MHQHLQSQELKMLQRSHHVWNMTRSSNKVISSRENRYGYLTTFLEIIMTLTHKKCSIEMSRHAYCDLQRIYWKNVDTKHLPVSD
jgi:hypothetical protein